MKIATVIYKSPIDQWVKRTIPLWLKCVREFYDDKDIVFITDKKSDWTDRIDNELVEAELLDFKPRNGKQHVVVSNFYRTQAFRLIGEPVTFLDLDCMMQEKLPDWNDDIFRVLVQRKGANKFLRIRDKVVKHYCAAVQYFGSDTFDEWKECFELTSTEPHLHMNRGIGEAAMCLMVNGFKNFEELPEIYGWPAWKEPHPKGVKILHYSNKEGKRLLKETKRSR